MKFAIAVVLALAVTIEGSAISWASHSHPEWSSWGAHGNEWSGAWDDGHHHGSWDHGHGHATHGISLDQGSAWGNHNAHYAPAHHDSHHHAHHDNDHHSAHYVAKTLGAVHTAPLPGHIDSVKSLNVEPAAHGSAWDHHSYHHAPAHLAHHDHHGHHDAHYVAKTLGAVHKAPLPGHVDNVKSFNVASAPGTHY